MSDAKTIDELCAEAEPVPCHNCDANCWKAGWLMAKQPDEEEEDRKNLCDTCFLFSKTPKGADRRFRGNIQPTDPKKDKPKAAKKPKPVKAASPKVVKKKPAAVKKTKK